MEEFVRSAGFGLLILLAIALVVLLGIAVYLLVRLVRLFAVVRSDDMPLAGKVTFWGALIYTLFPLDLLPDPVYLDDIGVLTAGLAFLSHLASKHGIAVGKDGITLGKDGIKLGKQGKAPTEIDRSAAPS